MDTCFKRATCETCGQVGHISKFCRNRKLFSLNTSGSTPPFVKGQLLGKELNFLLDADASFSILNQRLVDQFNWHDQLKDKATTTTLADGRTFYMRHSIDTALFVADTLVTCRLYVHVADTPVDAILGVDALSKLPCSISLGSHRILSVLPDCISYNSPVEQKECDDFQD